MYAMSVYLKHSFIWLITSKLEVPGSDLANRPHSIILRSIVNDVYSIHVKDTAFTTDLRLDETAHRVLRSFAQLRSASNRYLQCAPLYRGEAGKNLASTVITMCACACVSVCKLLSNNNGNNNNNNQDNVYGAVIMAEPLREFTRFIL